MDVLAEERTTLPEGATVEVVKYFVTTKRGGHTFTELRAWRDDQEVKMRVDDISACNLRQYMGLVIHQIQRHRVDLRATPKLLVQRPATIKDFVHNMAAKGMFIFNAIE